MLETRNDDGFEFSGTRRSLPMALLRARELLMERFRPMLHAHDVTEQQWRVLRVLYESESLDASELAARACILAPSLSRISRALESRRLIAVSRDPSDGRRSRIGLTDEGTAFIREIAPESAEIYARIEESVGRERIETLLEEIDVLIGRLDAKE